MASILIVEDEASVREMLVDYLSKLRYNCLAARNVHSAKAQLAANSVDLLLLDWNLPSISGVEFIDWLRKDQRHAAMPVIMLTARAEDRDQIMALSRGADDYLTKPFSLRVLTLRIEKLLQRNNAGTTGELQLGSLRLQVEERWLYVHGADGEKLRLAPMEARLLAILLQAPDQLLSRERLLEALWTETEGKSRSFDVHMRNLRKSLASLGLEAIETVYGAGYKLDSAKLCLVE